MKRPLRPALALALAALLGGCITIDTSDFGKKGLREVTLEPAKSWFTRSKVLLLDVEGFLSSHGEDGLLSRREGSVALLKTKLERAERDRNIAAVVLRVDSPGGEVTASDLLYRELLKFKEKTGRKVVVCMMGVAASGGYYVAMAGDRVIAHPSTITGSIGVIFHVPHFHGLLEKIGVTTDTIKTGPFKDIGSPLRKMEQGEEAILSSIIQDAYAQFLQVVEKGRPNLAKEQVAKLADGRIYSARQAQENGLVDEIGYLQDAIDEAKELAGVEDAAVIAYERAYQRRENIYSASDLPPPEAAGVLQIRLDELLRPPAGRLLYLWTPADK